ncbi:hypothetical protein CEUSTIGMA_g6506.t1 [Chlamydomonas eustigma]|uniref:Acyltransferase n=1 Tax=Chlamydomonas eustigma TaxID=1157962 RepID=A0A250X7N5_9CHLO|nr:hypothetical protein CEUSTIGMA_g6506.t1 [Chlamydomonas eustigma]|eukprot:GAX79066.1 hypothetical protein CEUSTIGMA_g6506.t1 [Chlamydomonas eustigma]
MGSTYDRLPSRWMQKLALSIVMLQLIGPFWYWPATIYLAYLNPLGIGRGLVIGYLVYIFVINNRAHWKPEGSTPIRRLKFWRHLADYFPAKMIKTAELDPKKNYIFCGHPHGVACFSYVSNFFIEATGFSEKFPGITLYPMILDAHFYTPVHREVALMSGFRSSKKEAMIKLLNGPPGSSVFLVPGGADEVLRSSPGTYDLVLNKRKGFIKLALQTGANLVPILGFGETDLFDISQPVPGTWVYRIQRVVLKLTTFAFPVITGAGFWSGSGPLPKSMPLHTVVGAPIQVLKWQGNTSSSDPDFITAVNELHSKYCEALRQLWCEHKDLYASGRRKSLEIVE